jgi:MoaA/NifB/PqqE/SkfB family radical SAM enzyme
MLRRLRVLSRLAGQYAGVAATALGLGDDRPLAGPLYAQVGVSDPCDHRCAMCPYHPPSEPRTLEPFGGARPELMPRATFQALVEDLRRLGTPRIDLVGRGEPLLHPEIVELVGYAKARGLEVAMISNGARLDLARAEGLVRVGLDRFRVSLDAATPESYARIHVGESAEAYARVKENVRALARLRGSRSAPHLTVSFTIGTPNWRELPAMVETARQLGVDAAHFQHVLLLSDDAQALVLDDEARAALPALAAEASRVAEAAGIESNLGAFAAWPEAHEAGVVPCYVGSFFTVVLGNGQVMPCCQTERPVGSLEHARFAEVWRGDRYRAFRRAARRLPRPDPALETCTCDRCYFRPHNVSVHNLLHPFDRIPTSEGALLSVDHLLRMSRLDRRPS